MKGGLSASASIKKIGRILRNPTELKSSPIGFTIIEVLIVLAVTSFLFVGAVALISGRQQQAAFNQSTRQIQSQIQQTISEIQVGFYPNRNNFNCTAGPSGPTISAGASNQGTNAGCILIGKALQFKVSGGSNPEKFAVHTIAGLQKNGSAEVTSLSEAKPKVVDPVTQTKSLEGGLSVVSMRYNNGGAWQNVGSVAFVSTFSQYSGGTLTGSQQVNMVAVNGTATNTDTATASAAINANLVTSPNPATITEICFASAGTNQSGLISIGGTGRQLSVTLTIKTGKVC